ncbi:hypothetical protein PWT90_06669 [Aphanocladium album]|nr:hypothetical protein PWT90_06669 [Aphanocladium album]
MTEREVIILDSDSDEDEDLRRAIALSLQDQTAFDDKPKAIDATKNTQTSALGDQVTFGSIALNRKEMEEARLNRLGKRRRNSNEPSIGEPQVKRPAAQRSGPGESQARYTQGIIRRTWTRGYPKTSDDITIEEVFQKDELQLALLSSFQWDEEWLLSKINVSKTRVLLLAFAASEEQMVFLIDLPRLEATDGRGMTAFGENVVSFLRASGVDDTMVRSLANYDFTATKDLGFVYSIPGGHTGEALLRVSPSHPVYSLTRLFSLADLELAGDDGMREYNARVNRKPNNKATRPADVLRNRFRIFFPANQTVAKSKGGRQSAGTICIQAKWWRAPTFPRELVRDCVNNREGLLMHSKIIFVRSPEGAGLIGQKSTGWAYIGSANLSESAWGRVVKERGTGSAKMSCRNWECGVIVPVKGDTTSGNDFSMFSGTVPVPMAVPGRPYETSEEPWFYLGGQ